MCAYLLQKPSAMLSVMTRHRISFLHLDPQSSALGLVPRAPLWHHNYHLKRITAYSIGQVLRFQPQLCSYVHAATLRVGQNKWKTWAIDRKFCF